VLEFQAEVEALLPLAAEELLVAEVALAQEVVLVEQGVLEISLLAEQVPLALSIKEPQVAEQVLQVLVAQETALQAERADLAGAEAAHQVSVLAVEEETELSISTTRNPEYLVNLEFEGTI